jgi:uncharacterized protein YkwD
MRARGAIAGLICTAAAAGLIAIPAAAPAQSDTTCPGASATPQSTTTEALGESVRCLLNEHRKDFNLGSLGRQSKLLKAGNAHAKDMVRHHFVSHLGSDGSTPLSRVRRTGFLKGARFFVIGEDLAWGENYQVTPENVVKAWLNSPVHRKNILDKRFNRVGVGVVRGDPSVTGDANGNALTYVAVFGLVKR